MDAKLKEIVQGVQGILSLAGCGGAHEIDRDEELRELSFDVLPNEDGTLTLVFDDGEPEEARYTVRIERA